MANARLSSTSAGRSLFLGRLAEIGFREGVRKRSRGCHRLPMNREDVLSSATFREGGSSLLPQEEGTVPTLILEDLDRLADLIRKAGGIGQLRQYLETLAERQE